VLFPKELVLVFLSIRVSQRFYLSFVKDNLQIYRLHKKKKNKQRAYLAEQPLKAQKRGFKETSRKGLLNKKRPSLKNVDIVDV
jgi:uncharacterized protein with von Willebrand factor type A (vWA) domain